MSEPKQNDYVATAAAEKRLREVLTARLGEYCEEDTGGVTADNLAYILLSGAQIEYKSRAKQVVISLDLPEAGVIGEREMKDARPDLDPTPATGSSPEPVAEPVKAEPTPAVVPFTPLWNPDAEYADDVFND